MAPVSMPNQAFTVGWICALPTERAVATTMLDELYDEPQEQHLADTNQYVLGRIKNHCVAIACLPAGEYGLAPAAAAAQQMLSSFPTIRFGLLVGIGGGIPGPGRDIRLGDIIISEPQGQLGGVVQYDRGKTFAHRFERTGFLNAPPRVLLNALNALKANHLLGQYRIPEFLQDIPKNRPAATAQFFAHPGSENDVIYEVAEGTSDADGFGEVEMPVQRPGRHNDDPVVHYGLIASGNQVIKDSRTRDRMRKELGNVLCFEMEAAGLMNAFPCLVIRGVSDYADYHKNDRWHGYAAATAAAAAKEVLYSVRAQELKSTDTASNAIDFLQSLSFQEMNRRQHEIDDAAEGTCGWLLQDPAFVQWKGEKNGLLWLTGKPGSGKSTLLKYALIKETQGDIVLSFFFYDRGSELQRTPRGVYQTFLHQLLLQNRERVRPHVLDIVEEFQEAHKSLVTLDQICVYQVNELQELLIKCLRRMLATHTVEILVDALDECAVEDILALERFFRRLQAETPALGYSVRLCVTCRHYPLVKWTGGVEICVDTRNLADIRIYVGRALEEFEDEADRHSLEEEIVDRSNGVFLWVRLVLPVILSQHRAGFSVEQMRSHLQTTPTDLNRVFQGIIHQLVEGRPENDSPQTLELFQWLCFASRPLSLTELRHAMNIRKKVSCPGKHLGSIKDNKQMEKRLKSLSGGLAEAKTYNDTPFAQLIHQTVKDYLTLEGFQILDRRLWSVIIVIGRAHIQLATACIKYMSTDEVVEREGHVSDHEFPFLDYAISSWMLHAEQAEAMDVAQDEILTCFDWPSSRKVDSWVRIWTQRSIEWPVPKTTLLHASARHGLFSAVAAQIWRITLISYILVFLAFKSGTVLERFKELARTALQAYYSHGHIDVDCKDEDGRTPLSLASEKGHLAIVKLLLSQDTVDVNSADTVGRTPLSWATTNGDDAVTWELVKRGADINKQVQMGMTPLHLAAQKGHETLVHLLVEAGARSDVQDERGRTALHEAALHGHTNVVQRLIEAGADINARDKNGDSVLHRACGSRDHALARLLVKREADVLAVAELLVKHGAEVNVENNNGETPLHRAAKNGRKALVLLILENGANASVADHEGRIALDVAAKNDKGDIVRLLQSISTTTAQDNTLTLQGAAQDGDLGVLQPELEENGESVTHSMEAAAKEGQEADVVLPTDQRLIKQSINAQAQALVAAAARGDVAIVEDLLKKNPALVDHADVEAALRKAAGDGQVDIVRLMLECSVNPRAPHEYEPSALHLAALHGQEKTAQLLLETGIGVYSEQFYRGHPLHYAAWAGQPALVELLLRHGAKANDHMTMSGDTALHVVAHTAPAGKKAILQLLQRKQLELSQEEAAVVDRYKAVIRILLKNGANPRLRNSDGHTATELAEMNDISPFYSV
ncbi:hypothetical protein Aspvir_000284 [Aspergillus viridinutans]|uniref:Uncharacterized protein n=1 Tax=Aspergillus viridinutans TaxID=75553 RepID=A0A9P3BL23_ASPVI|nr:uncharacterized protein Aspvir_000284 [Aspergillus viridinutans]GIJ98169.1 hypothetical protein Aspvir_000284 [Aspergillus viridinutans]